MSMNGAHWGKSSWKAVSLGHMRLTLKSKFTSPMSVKTSSGGAWCLPCRCNLMQRRQRTRTIEVGKPLPEFQMWGHTGERGMERKTINVKIVGNSMLIIHSLWNTWASTLERNPMCVRNVGKPSDIPCTSINIYTDTLLRRPINVKNVGEPSISPQILPYIQGFTQERGSISVWNVDKAIRIIHPLRAIWRSTAKRGPRKEREEEKALLFSKFWVSGEGILEGSSIS